jgi:hypothetical protein
MKSMKKKLTRDNAKLNLTPFTAPFRFYDYVIRVYDGVLFVLNLDLFMKSPNVI